jgi:hypothetical protein
MKFISSSKRTSGPRSPYATYNLSEEPLHEDVLKTDARRLMTLEVGS